MKRHEIIQRLLPSEPLPLWVPVLTHYQPKNGRAAVDVERMSCHLGQVARHVSSWMFAGSTGDGWELSDDQFDALLELAAGAARERPQARVLTGVLRPETEHVIAWIGRVHEAAGTSPAMSLEENVKRLASKRWAGITVCPPVGRDVSQRQIIEHYQAVAEAARMPLAVYQLPQVTQCSIEPATMQQLVTRHEEIILFKDSSGQDAISRAALDLDGVILVRGAEGDYAPMLEPLGGSYNGLLLSTANNFGSMLRGILEAVSAGQHTEALKKSESLSGLVRELFTAGAGAPVGNAFANVNRIVDHILAYGKSWPDATPPTLFDGSSLPDNVIANVAGVLERADGIPSDGYLSAT